MIFSELFIHNPRILAVPAGQCLFREGEAGGQMYVLSIGSAKLTVNGSVIETLGHGSVVGEMGLVASGLRTAAVVATEDCEFVEIDEQRFLFLVQQTPSFALQIMRLMADRWCAADQRLPANACV